MPPRWRRASPSATQALLGYRQSDGHWVFELEADSTIPSEYVLLRHYLGEPVDSELEAKIANYLRRIQGAHGGWPLVQDGAFDMSASVKAYFALKMIGDSVDAPHMARAREAIRSRGGAANSNVFTRFLLALFGVLTWRAVPVLPVEIMLLPMWSPFHLNKISYWARTTIVPLMVLAALKPRAKNPKGVGIDELFLQDPRSVGMTAKAPHQSRGWFVLFRALDIILRAIEPLFPKKLRARAIDSALAFIEERLNGEDGLGAIYPPMANTVMMYEALGKGADYPPRAITRRGIDKLLVIGEHEAYCQPCVSPVWDTALTCHALLEAGGEALPQAKAGARLAEAEAGARPQGRLGREAPRRAAGRLGVPVQQRPLSRSRRHRRRGHGDGSHAAAIRQRRIRRPRSPAAASGSRACRAATAAGPPSTSTISNIISTTSRSPTTARCSIRRPRTSPRAASRCWRSSARPPQTSKAVADGVAYLRRTQLAEGSWYGRWGLNYIYGTWSVLCALNAAGVDHQDPMIRKAVDWLVSIQNGDGGWGEDAVSYRLDYRGFEDAPSTSSQTAWALLGLMAAGEVENPALRAGWST